MNKFNPNKLNKLDTNRDGFFDISDSKKLEHIKRIETFSNQIKDSFPINLLENPKLVGDTFAVLSKEQYQYYINCLNEIIEKIGTSGLHFLNREFGIVRFDRYGVEKMVRQYKIWVRIFEGKEKISKCHIAFTAHEDNNSAFLYRNSYNQFEKLVRDSAGREKEVVYFEASRGVQMFRNLLKILSCVNSVGNIYLGFHGGNDIVLRRFPEFYSLDVTPPKKWTTVKARKIPFLIQNNLSKKMSKDSVIIVDSCNSGLVCDGLTRTLSAISNSVSVGADSLAYDMRYTGKNIWITNGTLAKSVPEIVFEEELGSSLATYFVNGEKYVFHL